MNKAILLGRLTKNPELSYTTGAEPIAVCKYSLAVNGKKENEVDFINCFAFGKTAEFANKYFIKGQQINIVGAIKVSSWNDKETNEKRYKTEIRVEEQFFAGDKPKGTDEPMKSDTDEDVPFN